MTARARLVVAAGALVGLLTVAGVLGWACGWRLHAMTTPSMGTTAPVGSLVVSRPATIASIHTGEFVVFHPPGRPGVTFAHRVVAVVHVGGVTGLQTRGDLNGARDTWVVTAPDLIGRVVAVVPAAGFGLRMLPALLLGSLLILLVTSGVSGAWRASLRILLGSVLAAALVWRYQPLERIDMVTQSVQDHVGVATVVPTGILPLRVSATGGSHTDLSAGQLGQVRLAHVGDHGLFRISSTVHLQGWWWLVLFVWTVPLVLGLRRAPVPA